MEKGDAVSALFRAECKTTSGGRKSISVKRDWIDKIKSEANNTGQTPILVFGWDSTSSREREDWFSFPRPIAERLISMVEAVLDGDIELAEEQAERIRDMRI